MTFSEDYVLKARVIRYVRRAQHHQSSGEMQIKTIVRYHHLTCNNVIKRTKDNKLWQECGERGTLVHCWWECELVIPLWKTVQKVLKKLKIKLPCDPPIVLLNICSKEMKSHVIPQLHCSITYNSQDMEAT